MIVDVVNEVPIVNGAVLIDCWEPKSGQEKTENDFFVRLLNKLINYPLESVINATYNVELTTQDPSIANTFRLYCWGEGDTNTNNTEIIFNLIRYCASKNRTSTLISEALLKNNYSLMLLEFNDFLFHWKYNLDCKVNNWIVAGQAWNLCLHNRPLGLEKMFYSVADTLNFYVVPELARLEDGSIVTREHFKQDWLPWQEISGFGYRLVTKAQKHWSNAVGFYKDFIHNGKIKITIHCTKSTLSLVPNSDEAFDVEIVCEADDWTFSYSRFLGQYNESATKASNQLRVWVFDIHEPLDLRTLISYATPISSAYQTKNNKVLLFHTGQITSIESIENFVK